MAVQQAGRAQFERAFWASYSDVELRRMLAVERLALTQQLVWLKCETSERVAQIERIERRLADIENSDQPTTPTRYSGGRVAG